VLAPPIHQTRKNPHGIEYPEAGKSKKIWELDVSVHPYAANACREACMHVHNINIIDRSSLLDETYIIIISCMYSTCS